MKNNIIECAKNVLVFTKGHDYPDAGSDDFVRLTILLDELETAFIISGIPIYPSTTKQ